MNKHFLIKEGSVRDRALFILNSIAEGKLASPSADTKSDDDYHYHATNIERARDIARRGMRVHRPSFGTDQREWPDGSRERRSYFNQKAHVVHSFAPEEGRSVILRVHKDRASFKKERGTGDSYLTDKLHSKHIEALSTKGDWVKVRRLVRRKKK